jgi:hypothetical protein
VKESADAKTNLVLARVLHDGDDLLSILLGELSRPLGERDVGLLQHNVGVTPTNTLHIRI